MEWLATSAFISGYGSANTLILEKTKNIRSYTNTLVTVNLEESDVTSRIANNNIKNRIGVIRRFFSKKTNLTFVTDECVREVENKLNNRPIRKFNYQTAN